MPNNDKFVISSVNSSSILSPTLLWSIVCYSPGSSYPKYSSLLDFSDNRCWFCVGQDLQFHPTYLLDLEITDYSIAYVSDIATFHRFYPRLLTFSLDCNCTTYSISVVMLVYVTFLCDYSKKCPLSSDFPESNSILPDKGYSVWFGGSPSSVLRPKSFFLICHFFYRHSMCKKL